MTISPFDSQIFGPLISDRETTALFSDETYIRCLLDFEMALAKVEAEEGVIPQTAFKTIRDALKLFRPNPIDLRQGTALDGVPVPALLKLCRQVVGGDAQHYLHWGATSQDAIDTALVLRLVQAVTLLKKRLSALIESISVTAREHAGTLMLGRTRFQQAIPTTFGFKAVGWAAPLKRHLQRLDELTPRLLVLSFGGAVGTLAALGDKAEAIQKRLAGELQLFLPATTWHTQRDNMAEFASWLSLTTGTLGKIGQDLVLLAQSEVGEIRIASGGGSSTMPQKANPISGEVLVALARFNAGQVGSIHQGVIQEHERGGPGWMVEWLVLPPMITAAAAGLNVALQVFERLEVDARRMKDNMDHTHGLCLAEAAVFALSGHMDKTQAQALVKEACRVSKQTHEHMVDILSRKVDQSVDWHALKNYQRHVGMAVRTAQNWAV